MPVVYSPGPHPDSGCCTLSGTYSSDGASLPLPCRIRSVHLNGLHENLSRMYYTAWFKPLSSWPEVTVGSKNVGDLFRSVLIREAPRPPCPRQHPISLSSPGPASLLPRAFMNLSFSPCLLSGPPPGTASPAKAGTVLTGTAPGHRSVCVALV